MPKLKRNLVYSLFFASVLSVFLAQPAALADSCSNPSPTPTDVQQCLKGDPIVTDLNTIINFLSAGVGIVVVGTIILGGIQYIMAGDSADAIGKAKQRIINGTIALAVFILIFSFVQWLVPGGVF